MTRFPASIVRPRWPAFAAAVILLASPAFEQPARAHHSFAAVFDAERVETIKGEVQEVRFANPHIRYRVLVEKEDGTTEEWEVQSHEVRTMRRMGWGVETVRPGDVIEVTGALGRRGARRISMDMVVLPDGSRHSPGGGYEDSVYTTTDIAADPGKTYGVADTTDYPIDITGFWTNRYQFRLTVDDLEPKPTPFTTEGRRRYEATESWQDPRKRCASGGLPRHFGAHSPMQILDAGTHYVMILGESVRRIWMDGRQASPNTLPSAMGFSHGRWEDDELVVETTHLSPGWLDGSGLPMSGDGTRVVARYSFGDDHLTIARVMTIHDPNYTAPLTRRRGSARDDDVETIVSEGGTDCDSTEFLRDLGERGLLESLSELEQR